jgi:hypothetical protein
MPDLQADVSEAVVWEDPSPTFSRTVASYAGALKQIKARPNTWGRLRVYPARPGAYTAACSLTKRITDNRWEFRSARLMDGSGYGLYARYRNPR